MEDTEDTVEIEPEPAPDWSDKVEIHSHHMYAMAVQSKILKTFPVYDDVWHAVDELGIGWYGVWAYDEWQALKGFEVKPVGKTEQQLLAEFEEALGCLDSPPNPEPSTATTESASA